MKSTVGKWLRWILPLAVLVVMGIFFRDELDFLSDGFRTLRHAQPWPLVVVFITFAFSLLAMAEVMRKLFVAGGVPVSFKECNNIVFASNAWSTTLPGGPAFAAILTYKVQRAWGLPWCCAAGFCAFFCDFHTVGRVDRFYRRIFLGCGCGVVVISSIPGVDVGSVRRPVLGFLQYPDRGAVD